MVLENLYFSVWKETSESDFNVLWRDNLPNHVRIEPRKILHQLESKL